MLIVLVLSPAAGPARPAAGSAPRLQGRGGSGASSRVAGSGSCRERGCCSRWCSCWRCCSALYFTPLAREAALRFGIVDRPDGKAQAAGDAGAVPRGASRCSWPTWWRSAWCSPFDTMLLGLLLAGTLTLLVGLVDDFGVLTPLAKLAGQAVAVFVLLRSGAVIELAEVPQPLRWPLAAPVAARDLQRLQPARHHGRPRGRRRDRHGGRVRSGGALHRRATPRPRPASPSPGRWRASSSSTSTRPASTSATPAPWRSGSPSARSRSRSAGARGAPPGSSRRSPSSPCRSPTPRT